MMKCEWILCPVCGSKTRNKIRKDTVLENYPLYCPKCRQERLIKVDNLKITVMPFNYTHIVTEKERCRSNPGIGGIYVRSNFRRYYRKSV